MGVPASAIRKLIGRAAKTALAEGMLAKEAAQFPGPLKSAMLRQAALSPKTETCALVCPVDDAGHLVDPVTDYNGMFFKEADPKIIADLQAKGRLLFEGVCRHPYPHCWRTDSPLMYRTFKSWFIRVTDLKDDLIANN